MTTKSERRAQLRQVTFRVFCAADEADQLRSDLLDLFRTSELGLWEGGGSSVTIAPADALADDELEAALECCCPEYLDGEGE